MYEQTLVKVVEPVKLNTIKRLNKSKKWKYGYNKEANIVSISKTGQIGEIIEIQGFQIALPKQPKNGNDFHLTLILKGLKLYLIGRIIQMILKKNIMDI